MPKSDQDTDIKLRSKQVAIVRRIKESFDKGQQVFSGKDVGVILSECMFLMKVCHHQSELIETLQSAVDAYERADVPTEEKTE